LRRPNCLHSQPRYFSDSFCVLGKLAGVIETGQVLFKFVQRDGFAWFALLYLLQATPDLPEHFFLQPVSVIVALANSSCGRELVYFRSYQSTSPGSLVNAERFLKRLISN